ncbi:MAG: GntP family permease [Treponema sp.]|nr:GntP family permease [Treponema sp.]
MTIGIIGMFLAILVMIFGAYRGLKPIVLTLLASLVVILFNQMGIWRGYSEYYVGGFVGIFSRFMFVFISSAAYAAVMEKTGSTAAIGQQLVKWFGIKNVMWIVYAFTVILTFSGVMLFVVMFAVVPIAFVLFKEAGLPRHLIMAPMAAGGATITMTTLPGTISLTNIIPARALGTPMTAAPVFSLIFAAAVVVFTAVYFKWAEKDARKKNEVFEFPKGFDASSLTIDKSKLPHPVIAFVPIVVAILFIVVNTLLQTSLGRDPVMLASLGMLLALILCLVLNPKKIGIDSVIWTQDGATNGIYAIVPLASVVAFGAVVQNAPVFQSIIDWLMNLDMNIYVKGAVSTAVISGITGSSSGGAQILLDNLGEFFKTVEGVNLPVLHRVIAISGGSLDTLPHVSAIFLFLSMIGCTHKEAYRHLWWTTVVIPTVLIVVALVPIVFIF